jgi:hypothetical protein
VSANESVVAVAWSRGHILDFTHAGWAATYAGQQTEFLFNRARVDAIPRDLRASDVHEKFFDALSQTKNGDRFLDWFGQIAALGPRFDLYFREREWSIPWELLIDRLHLSPTRRGVAFVRRLSRRQPAAPYAVEDKLRTLLLLGADNPPDGAPLRLDEEAETVRRGWRQLDQAARACVEEPVVERVNATTLSARVADYRPHVILYSGHGSNDPSSIQMADNGWLRPKQFAKAVTPPSWRPIYIGFWACSTARDNAGESALTDAPSFASELLDQGIVSVLAMQSPIGDKSATYMARTFFEQIAAGHTMERAIAEARGELYDRSTSKQRFDWASPVVWTASDGVVAIQWNSEDARLIQRQLVGRRLIASGIGPVASTAEHGIEFEHGTLELDRARNWAGASKVWVDGDVSDALMRQEWTRSLAALQAVEACAVIAPELREPTPNGLAAWAERVKASFLPGELPDDVATALSDIVHAAQRGWKRLCAVERVVIAISGEVPANTETWFWAPILDPKSRLVILCRDREPVPGFDWHFDSLGTHMTEQEIDDAVRAAPRLSRALAILNAPIADELVLIETNADSRTLADWPQGRPILVRLPNGVVLRTDARRQILDQSNRTELALAHYDAAVLLGNDTIRLTPEIRRQRVLHLVGARSVVPHDVAPVFDELFAVEVDRLLSVYRETSQARAVVELHQLIRAAAAGMQDLLLPSTRLDLAWAYLRLGKVNHARYWIDRAHPQELLENAFKHGLLAEILKSDGGGGAKQAVLTEIDRAIDACRKAVETAKTAGSGVERAQAALRAYQQDRARILLFLFDDAASAKLEYERLLREWANEPLAVLDIGVMKRNYAEVIRSQSEKPDDDAARKAREQLAEALRIVEQFPNAPALAEVEYEAARDAEYRNSPGDEQLHLERAVEAARRSGFDMVRAIAENRRFWKFEEFSAERWRTIADDLEAFASHGWAVRTLVDASLCAANLFLERGDRASAAREIARARSVFNAHPLFDGRSDRWRRAAIAAGSTVVGEPDAASTWQTFRGSADWVDKWTLEQQVNSPEAVWRRRIGDSCRPSRRA